MKKTLITSLVALALLAGVATDAAAGGHGHGHGHGNWHGGHGNWHGGGGNWHGGGHSHFDFYLGADPFFWGPRYYNPYPAPYYYQQPTVIIERQPPVYVQRPPDQTAQVWYYCTNPAGYYPYVQTCPQQWVTVDPSSVPPAPPH